MELWDGSLCSGLIATGMLWVQWFLMCVVRNFVACPWQLILQRVAENMVTLGPFCLVVEWNYGTEDYVVV